MRPGMRMLMITNRREGNRPSMGGSGPSSGSGPDMAYGPRYENGPGMAYGPRYENGPGMGGFYPYMNTGGDYTRSQYENNGEARFRDRRGREHYDNGRFAPRSAMDEPEERYRGYETRERAGMHLPPYPPPVYEEGGGRPMNKIGFSTEPRSHDRPYRQDAGYERMMEGNRMAGGPPLMGYGRGNGGRLTREMAEEWTASMKNEDGSKGPHWTMEQSKQLMQQRSIDADPVEFWAALNALYSDYCSVLKKHGISSIDVYADLAAAWLEDRDAVPNKAAMYYECIVK